MLRKITLPISMVLLASIFACRPMDNDALSLGAAGVATPQPDTLTIAAPLANLTDRTVTSVKIERIQLATAALRTSLPITVSDIQGHGSENVQADFDSKSLVAGRQYELVLEGTYRGDDGKGRHFRLSTFVFPPPASPGSHAVGTTQVPSQKVEGGPYPHQPPRMDKDVNQAAPVVPTTQ